MIKNKVEVKRAIRDMQYALTAYPFTHVTINDDGNLVFKRWLRATGLVIEVSYEQVNDNLVIFIGSAATYDIEGGSILWYGPIQDVPGDDRLLELARLNITWEVT